MLTNFLGIIKIHERGIRSQPTSTKGPHFGFGTLLKYCWLHHHQVGGLDFFPRASEQRVLLIVEVCHHIFSSSHLHNFSSSHLLHNFSSSHLLHIFSSSHFYLHIFSSSHLVLLPSCLSFFSISLLWGGAVQTRRQEMQPFRTKWGSIVKNWGKIVIFKWRSQTFRTKWGSIVKNCGKIAILKYFVQAFYYDVVLGRTLCKLCSTK